MTTPNALNKIDWQILATMLYLGIPNVIFGLYLSPITLLISVIALIYILWIGSKSVDLKGNQSSNISIQIPLFLVCIVWVFLSGMTGQIYSNPDWPVRLTVLNDLITNHWPVIYEQENQRYFLRAPLGYYLPGALIGKMFDSYSVGLWFLFTWGVIGTYLTLSIAIKNYTFRKAAIGIAIIIFFSGLDVIGFLARHHGELYLGDHLEWWAGRWQYSSNTTLLFWAPNHAIPAWLFTALMMRKNVESTFWNASPILLGMTLIFSPLSLIGSFLLYSIFFYKKIIYSIVHNRIYTISILIALLIFTDGGIYFLNGISEIKELLGSKNYTLPLLLVGYVLFTTMEFGLLAFSINKLKINKINERWLWASITILFALPLLPVFGPGNDLTMRSSIAPLFCLCLIAVDALFSIKSRQIVSNRAKYMFLLLLAIGSLTAFFEFTRPLVEMHEKFIPTNNLINKTEGISNHYYHRIR